ncbi:hypothetical protein C923_02026 [Plasmodium falciparum UGT5.1]|uniref:Uncharacterized protein n=1 Tax=Plasmodium falciparum UGT5.1 TaxID=1237627 RepID=W7JQK9_PLAFA|nr:hypothetical protein C923_02026 [Plasmodium falciparum UGT5.1]
MESSSQIGTETLQSVFNKQKYTNVSEISEFIYGEYSPCLPSVPGAGAGRPPLLVSGARDTFCSTFDALYVVPRNGLDPRLLPGYIKNDVEKIVAEGIQAADAAAKTTANQVTSAALKTKTAAF